ncbi:MAG: Mini-ribonuclease 3 [Clostridia bacterium]|nr:Mini-ribonuclease 3 [Clostridia bacterium]
MISLDEVLDKNSALQLSSVTLAFIGDAVYSLYVRRNLVFKKDEKGAVLNKKASEIVCASAQADFIDRILPVLSEEEIEVFKRARNTKKGTRAKHASVGEYNKATGFEALVGFLHITGQKERLNYLFSYGEQNEN